MSAAPADRTPRLTTASWTRIWRGLWAAAILFMFYALTLPFSFVSDGGTVRQHWAEAIGRSGFEHYAQLSRADVLQNVLLFVPIGFFGVGSFFRARPVGALFIATSAAAALSAACELLQLLTVDRVTSLWDVWANVIGAIIGAVLWLSMRPIGVLAWSALPEGAVERRRAFPLACAVALVAIAACEPFDITLDVGIVWSKVKSFVATPWLWMPVSDELVTVLRFAILSFLTTQWARPRNNSNTLLNGSIAVAVGALVALILETMQFLITSRYPSTEDVLAGCSGSLLGVVVVPPLLRRFRAPTLVTIATAAAAVPFYLQPFLFAPSYHHIGMLPFFAYYERTSLQTVSHVLGLMLLYAPVAFATVWSQPHGTVMSAGLRVILIAAPLEYAQGWIIGRFPDLTDVGIAVLGAMAGAAIARFEVTRSSNPTETT